MPGLEIMDKIFTVLFAIELCINAFAHWFKPFISDGWNIFDVLVVTISLIALGPVKIPVNVIRSLRAFRLIRIFRRFKGLKNIVSGLASSVSPVLQALLVLFIAMAICALHSSAIAIPMLPDQITFLSIASSRFFYPDTDSPILFLHDQITSLQSADSLPPTTIGQLTSHNSVRVARRAHMLNIRPLLRRQTQFWEPPSLVRLRRTASGNSTQRCWRSSVSRPAWAGRAAFPRCGTTGAWTGGWPST